MATVLSLRLPWVTGDSVFIHLPTLLPRCTWMSWLMLSRMSTVLRDEANARFSLQSHRLAHNCDDKAWLHWQIWNRQWRMVNLTDRLSKCGVIHLRLEVQLKDPRNWHNICFFLFHSTGNLSWHHEPWRIKVKTRRWENSGILFLEMWNTRLNKKPQDKSK